MGRSLRESASISPWIADVHLVWMDWFYPNLVGGMRLQVHERDEAAVREILEEGLRRQSRIVGRKSTYSQPARSAILCWINARRENNSDLFAAKISSLLIFDPRVCGSLQI